MKSGNSGASANAGVPIESSEHAATSDRNLRMDPPRDIGAFAPGVLM